MRPKVEGGISALDVISYCLVPQEQINVNEIIMTWVSYHLDCLMFH